jgi:putative transposase
MVSAPVRREQVAYARHRGLSSRFACALLQVSRSTLGYESRMERRDAPLMNRMKRLALENNRYGYRRVRVLLGREGIALSWARTHRLWRKAGLSLPLRRPRRRVRRSEPRPLATSEPNEVWAYDFVFDRCTNGQGIKCLTVVDEGSRECLAIDVAGSIRSRRVIEVLSGLVARRGAPQHLRSDNGPEFLAYAVQDWLRERRSDRVHRAGQAVGSMNELHRAAARRVLECRVVREPRRGPGLD